LEDSYLQVLNALLLLRINPGARDEELVSQGRSIASRFGGIAGQLAKVQKAVESTANGKPSEAIRILEALMDEGGAPFQARSALLEAYLAAGRVDQALELARWMRAHRGLAYMEQGCSWCQQSLNVMDSTLAALKTAEVLARLDRLKEAAQELSAFDEHWNPEKLPEHLKQRRDAVAAVVAGSST
jgi:hypothetical protein